MDTKELGQGVDRLAAEPQPALARELEPLPLREAHARMVASASKALPHTLPGGPPP